MVMLNWFCGMVDRWKVFSLISSRDHCQRSSPSRISDTPRAGFEPAQNLNSGFVEWNCAVAITTTPRYLCCCNVVRSAGSDFCANYNFPSNFFHICFMTFTQVLMKELTCMLIRVRKIFNSRVFFEMLLSICLIVVEKELWT